MEEDSWERSFFIPYLHILNQHIFTVAVSWLISMKRLGESHRLSSHVWTYHYFRDSKMHSSDTRHTNDHIIHCCLYHYTHKHKYTALHNQGWYRNHCLLPAFVHINAVQINIPLLQLNVVMTTHCWSFRSCRSQCGFLRNCPPGTSIYHVL